MSAGLRVIAPGIHVSLQDLGRIGYQDIGVPVSGALDPVALRLANVLVDNAQGEAALEILHFGPTLEVCAESVRVALAGSDAKIEVTGRSRAVSACQTVRLERGEQFRITATGSTGVTYLAAQGGFDVAEVLGSRSTFARGGFGGFHGRAVAAGDHLGLRLTVVEDRPEWMFQHAELKRPEVVRVVLGPQDDHFTDEALATFANAEYAVSRATDRMGMRLEGPVLAHLDKPNIVSDGIAPGAIQVPGDGAPIILLADRQTTGGYPKIATVIWSDLPGLGRLRPGDLISFEVVTLDAAVEARRELVEWLLRLREATVIAAPETTPNEDLLHSANIIGGVVNANEID